MMLVHPRSTPSDTGKKNNARQNPSEKTPPASSKPPSQPQTSHPKRLRVVVHSTPGSPFEREYGKDTKATGVTKYQSQKVLSRWPSLGGTNPPRDASEKFSVSTYSFVRCNNHKCVKTPLWRGDLIWSWLDLLICRFMLDVKSRSWLILVQVPFCTFDCEKFFTWSLHPMATPTASSSSTRWNNNLLTDPFCSWMLTSTRWIGPMFDTTWRRGFPIHLPASSNAKA